MLYPAELRGLLFVTFGYDLTGESISNVLWGRDEQ